MTHWVKVELYVTAVTEDRRDKKVTVAECILVLVNGSSPENFL